MPRFFDYESDDDGDEVRTQDDVVVYDSGVKFRMSFESMKYD